MRNNKGVTMMLLVVTIILMIIIAFLAVFYSQNVTPEARISAAYTSLNAVKESCIAAVQFTNVGQEDEYHFFGKTISQEHPTEVSDYESRCGLSSSEHFGNRTYLIDPFSTREEDKRRITNLELSNLKYTFVVDLDNEKYYIVDGVSRNTDGSDTRYEYFDIQAMYDMLGNYGKV
ncbi:MAG: hypothetical protein IKR04_01720 [Clostridia bacterium]|nr:hypothetical protein [Clostridia bacterium]